MIPPADRRAGEAGPAPEPAAQDVTATAETKQAAPEVFSVVSSRRVFDGVVASVRIDEVVMPGGGTAKREVVEHGGAVAVVALDIPSLDISSPGEPAGGGDASPSVILIEQYRHALGRRLWELPAGLLDVEDEPAQGAAERELTEETGYRASNWAVLLDVATSPGFTEEWVRVFLATGLTQVGRPDSEHEEADLRVVRVPLSVAVEAALAGEIVNVMAVSGILAADAVLRGASLRSQDVPDGGDAPWKVNRGPGAPAAPPLDGIPLR